ncbi:MAG: N-acetyltransferase family protein, partial [Solirubrobacteraceae bacterium]
MIRPLRETDRPTWTELYRGYGAFYDQPKSDDDLDALWPRVFGVDAEVEAFVAVLGEEHPIGFVHVREFARPLHGSRGLYLDDLFVDPASRGAGIGRA